MSRNKKLPRWAKIYLAVVLALFVILAAVVRYAPNVADTAANVLPGEYAWQDELTDGTKAMYGPNWKPTAHDKNVIAAFAHENAKNYRPPKDDD
jgi:predicted PurR-regulated permease PerM